ncbi:SsgA family sporulation/cell division regulator [Amycolatopsis suaedae]|uniref:SsgA family sporulation/cell division regulator n=1 Tax=Amycolatopsis suaedae TaxID=2510978 RepID=A0A4Q7JAB7_9PSEU|nr:SsgA family sporulation/cell division regulator [Amycolatopsis suaedae]RZQ64209.1 SsgA family sporulation/cell division regulator [Amycolatopsis suaedae]
MTRRDVAAVLLVDVTSLRGVGVAKRARTDAHLSYRASDPWAVRLAVHTDAGWVGWSFARSLLADGLNGRAGEGDVTVFPHRHGEPFVHVILSSPTGTASLRFDRAGVEAFLDRADKAVPEGTEASHVDWTRELDLLAGGGPR